MGRTMKAVVYDAPGVFAVSEVPVPEPGSGEVLLKISVAGVCGTDLHLHAGEFGPTYPLTPGHEFVGEVVAAGVGVPGDLSATRWWWTTRPAADDAPSADGPGLRTAPV